LKFVREYHAGKVVSGSSIGPLVLRVATEEAAMTDNVGFDVRDGSDGPVVRLAGEIDLASVGPLRDFLLGVDGLILTIDFSAVTFMDSTGVNVLVKVQRRLHERGGTLVLCGLRPNQMRVLEVLGMSEYFDSIAADESSAFDVVEACSETAPTNSSPRDGDGPGTCARVSASAERARVLREQAEILREEAATVTLSSSMQQAQAREVVLSLRAARTEARLGQGDQSSSLPVP